MEYHMNQESEILRNQKEFQRFRKKLFEVHLKPGKAIAKKFENYIDENEYEMLFAVESVLDTNEATVVAEEVTTAKDADLVKDGNTESHHGEDETRWTAADTVEDGPAIIDDYRELIKETAIAGFDDDDDDGDYGDNQDCHAIVNENAHEERKLDCEFISDDEHVETIIRETPSFDCSIDSKDVFAQPRLMGTSGLTTYEAFGAACALGIWVDRIGLMDAIDGTGTLRDIDHHKPSIDDEEPDDRNDTTSERGKVTKLLAFVREILRVTVQELSSGGTFDQLRLVNDSMLNVAREEQQLEAELAHNRTELSILRATIKERKKHYNTDKWRIQSDICNLDKQFKKILKLIDLEADYIKSWETQCLNENGELLKEEANRLRLPIQHDSTSIARNVIFPELIANINLILEKWERMYDIQVSAIDVDTLTLENEEEQENDQIKNLQEICDWMQITIDEFEVRKQKYEERMKYEAHINKMATRIQAFWRGTRVRRCLGPYKYLRKLFRKKLKKGKKSKKKK